MWQQHFPPDIIVHLVSDSNPSGNLTISNLETTGVTHQDILAQEHDVWEASISVLNDNTLPVSCSMKCSITTCDAMAYLSSHISGLHKCHFHYNINFQHISGPTNAMADNGSHLFKLSDTTFLAHFEIVLLPWQLCHLQPKMNSTLISMLHKKQAKLQSFLNMPRVMTINGISGKIFAWSTLLTHSLTPLKTQFNTSWSLLHIILMAALPKMVSLTCHWPDNGQLGVHR